MCSGSLFPPLVEGRPLLEKTEGEPTKQGAGMGCDGIAISADGSRLFYCPLGSRTRYSVETDELVDRSFAAEMTANVVEEGDKGGAGDGTESDAAGNLYATNYEHNAVLRRRPDTEWRRSPTIRACSGRPRCRRHGRLPVRPANQLTARRATTKVRSPLDALLALPHPDRRDARPVV